MDQKKVDFKAEKKNLSKDSIIILQGSNAREINFLHKGAIEVKICSDNTAGLNGADIIKKSKRIGVIEAPSIFGINNLINSKAHESSYVALTECSITKYIIPSNDFIGFFKSNPPISLNVLLTMQEEARKRLSNLKKYSEFIGFIDKFYDNLLLLYLHATQTKKDKLYQTFINNGGKFPKVIEADFLTQDNSANLNKNYQDPSYNPYIIFDKEKLDFYKNLIKTKPAAFISILSGEINIFVYMFEVLSSIINSLNTETEKFALKVEGKLNTFFLDSTSPFNMIYSITKKIKENREIDGNIPKAIVKICRNIEHINKQLGAKEYTEVFSKYDVLNESSLGIVSVSDNGAFQKTDGKDIDGKYKKMFKDSTKKILSYSTLGNDTKSKIVRHLREIEKINPEDTLSKETRMLIKNLQDDYYALYKNIFLKTIKHPDNIPPYIKLFLYFSFIDEKLITENQLEFIYNSLNLYSNIESTYPIITLYDFLVKIYKTEEEPSLSELGEFRKLLTKHFSKNEKPIEDTPAGRLEFELDNMVSQSMRITSDNMRAFIPYLTEKSFKGTLSQVLNTPKKIDTFIKKIVTLDYSLFFRELTWKIPGKSELIKKEVKPYLIIIPNAGSRVQLWQEMVYNVRSTRARFLLPIVFNGDLNKALVHACGHFRWNLNKAMVTNWMDPVEGGLSGAYYDYEQTYKKNTELSDEVKDKIKEQIRTIKIDRNRFAQDYFEWLMYESCGVPKLNKVLRKIFFRYIPFPKAVRDKLARLPVYNELDRKFNIIRNRDFKKLEARYKKYGEGDMMPEDLRAYLEMMQK